MKKQMITMEAESSSDLKANRNAPNDTQKIALLHAYRRLREKGLTGSERVSISRRIPGRPAFFFLEWVPGIRDAKSGAPAIKHIKLFDFNGRLFEDESEHNTRPPAHIGLHAQLYRLRPDAGAIVRYRPRCASTLNRIEVVMPGIFDEQVRQLGSSVETLRENGTELDRASEKLIRGGANVFLYAGDVLALGYSQERVIFNCELIEKCARAFLLALATGHRVRRIPWLIRRIAGGRMRRDGKQAAAAYARGEFPEGISAY